jgi:hypothetical protein
VLQCADNESMTLHLAEIARTVAHGANGMNGLDGAGSQGAGVLTGPDTISRLHLPPHSPN